MTNEMRWDELVSSADCFQHLTTYCFFSNLLDPREVFLRCRWSGQVVLLSCYTFHPVRHLLSFTLKRNTLPLQTILHTVNTSCRTDPLVVLRHPDAHLEEGLSSCLVLKLTVCPLEDVDRGLAHVDPQSCAGNTCSEWQNETEWHLLKTTWTGYSNTYISGWVGLRFWLACV